MPSSPVPNSMMLASSGVTDVGSATGVKVAVSPEPAVDPLVARGI